MGFDLKTTGGRDRTDTPCGTSILAFLHDFDNKQSERELRMINVRQKISGIFRSCDALENFCRIWGYVSTARKNSLAALRRIFLGTSFLSPQLPTPP